MKRAVLMGAVVIIGVLALWFSQRDNGIDIGIELPAVAFPVDRESSATVEPEEPVLGEEEHAERMQGCAEPLDPDQTKLAGERLEREVELAQGVLQQTNSSEYLLAAALLNGWKDPRLAMDLLQRSAADHLNDPILIWTALVICGQRPGLDCDFGELEETAIDVDADNGAMWVQIAGLRLGSDDEEGAIDALRHAISAPRFDSYYDEQIMLVERGLAVGSNLSFSERALMAWGTASVTPIGLGSLTARCKSGADGVWSELCEQLGSRMTTDSGNSLTKMIGMDLRQIVLTNQLDEKGLTAIARERDALRQSMGSIEQNEQMINLMMNDELVLRNYLENLEVYGEDAARQSFFAEMQRLKNSPEYDQCNFVSFGTDL